MSDSIRVCRLLVFTLILLPFYWLPTLIGFAAVPSTQYLTSDWKLARVPDIPQAGTQISQPGFNAGSWIDAVVPGTVLTSYQNAGIVSDPYFSTNMQAYSLSGYYDTDYWYRNAFFVPASYAGQKIWLNFDGIHWKADVYVNGAYLGQIKGPFKRSRFDVTSLVTTGATNAIAIQIYWCNATVWDTPTFIGTGGWDFMPTVAGRDVGLYEGVYLSTSGSVNIVDPFVSTTLPLPATSPASVNLQVGLTNSSGSIVIGTLQGTIAPEGISFRTSVVINANSTATVTLSPAIFPQLSITNPALWWPNGYGPQNLHNLQLSFQTGGATTDVQNVSFGIRQFTYNRSAGDMQVSCNGQKIFCKGGNWGMPDAMLKFTPEQLDTAVRLHKEMNFTMIRCWHGTSDLKAFYDACDKYGIMVWDEFWLNGSNFGLGPTDPAMFITNSIDKYKRLRNRASLAVWCGENEAVPPSSLQLGQNYTNLDNTRIYIDASNVQPVHGGLGLYEEMDPNYYFTHAYGFTTEIGSTCVPTLESMQAMIPASSLWPPGDSNWVLHNWQYNISGYTNQLASSYGPLTDITNFCTKAQLLNYQTYRAIFEAWNGQMWNTPSTNPCSGVLLWMSQQAWPSIIWQTYDWYFNPTGGYFGSKKGCEPVHIQWDSDDSSIRIVNATTQDLTGLSASIQVCNLNGVQQYATNLAGLNVPANTASNCFRISSGLVNLALNRAAYASSIDNLNDAISYAVDGNLGTRWSSAYSDPQWYYVDLGSTQTINNVTILWQTAAYGKAFQIRVSNDAITWTTVWSTNNLVLNSSLASDWSVSSFAPVNARYVEMYGTSRATIWGYSMFEFQVFNMPASGSWMNNLSSTYFIKLKLNDASGNLLSDNFYWVGTNYLNYTALNSLPTVSPGCSALYAVTNGTAIITATVTNGSTNVAFDVVLQLLNQTTGARVLPAIYSDNYFSLLAGEARTVTIEVDTNSAVASGPLRLMLNGWNVPSQQMFALTLNPGIPVIGAALASPGRTVSQWMPATLVCSNWSGTPPYSFQWQMSGTGGSYTNVPGATTNVLNLPNATLADSGYYELIFTANGQSVTSSVAPLTVLPGAGGATGPRLSVKFAADRNYNFDAINNGWPAGALNTKQWFNLYGPTSSSNGVTSVPFYSSNGVARTSRTVLVYNYSYEYNTINEQTTQPNNISLVDSYISMNDGWYLSVTNLDPVFTNSYKLYCYFLAIDNTFNKGGKNYIRYYSGLTTNTTVLGTCQWNLYTTTTARNQTFVQDLTPSNTSSSGETPGANYFVISNLSGGSFDLLITNSFYGGIAAIEVVADQVSSACTLRASITNTSLGNAITFTNQVVPSPGNGELVAFYDGSTILGTGNIDGGSANFTTTNLSAGTHSITAVYGGNGSCLASTSSVVSVTILSSPTLSPAVAVPSTNVYAGMNVVLVCSNYTGNPPYSFQWLASADGVTYTNIIGATANQMNITGVTPSDSGKYQLVFTASGLSVTSSVAQLMVYPPAAITVQQAGGKLVLRWPLGTLLQATNLAGPWDTNNSASPYTNQPNNAQMFYRVLVQ
jgi:hypothetical protein